MKEKEILQFYTGIVEDRDDPEKRGRVKVRIVGLHNFNGNEVTIESLPWAEPVLSLSMSPNIYVPKIGYWVHLFLQNNDPNYPVYFGMSSGEKLVDFAVEATRLIRYNEEERNQLIKKLDSDPKTLEREKGDCEGTTEEWELSLSALGRGNIDCSPLETANRNKSHVCNISYGIRMRILQGSAAVRTAVEWLRNKIKSLMSSFSNSAFGQWLSAGLKQITSLLKKVRKFIKFVNDVVLEIAKIVKKIQELIAWILSLPTKLLAFLQNCLSDFLSSISSAITEGWGSVTDSSGVTTAFSEVRNLVNETVGVIEDAGKTVASFGELGKQFQSIPDTFAKV